MGQRGSKCNGKQSGRQGHESTKGTGSLRACGGNEVGVTRPARTRNKGVCFVVTRETRRGGSRLGCARDGKRSKRKGRKRDRTGGARGGRAWNEERNARRGRDWHKRGDAREKHTTNLKISSRRVVDSSRREKCDGATHETSEMIGDMAVRGIRWGVRGQAVRGTRRETRGRGAEGTREHVHGGAMDRST